MAPSPNEPARAAARRAELFLRHARRDHRLPADEARRLLAGEAAVAPAAERRPAARPTSRPGAALS